MLKTWKDKMGFTLIEMILVLILIAVLAAIAIPIYSNYRLKGLAGEANSLLGAAVSGADAFFQEKATYSGYGASTEFSTIVGRARYFSYSTGNETATGNGTNAGITKADTLTVTISTTAATTWVATGDCTAPY